MYSTSEQKLFNLLHYPENPKGNNMQYILFVINQTQSMTPKENLNLCLYQAFFCYYFITINQNKTQDALIFTK